MKQLWGSIALMSLLAPCLAQIPSATEQLLIVTTHDWPDVHGRAQRYERRGGHFQKVGAGFPVVVGKSGLGWGRGLTMAGSAATSNAGPDKREGDGKSPAGIFSLGAAFGYEPSIQTRWPYLPLTATIRCVDDLKSAHYNQLIDALSVSRDWSSSEQMRRSDELYHYGVLVKHNVPAVPAVPALGSCIFLHIWEGPDTGTLGCTAMDEANMLLLLTWFDPRKQPLLVQLPQAQYRRHRSSWNLPRL